MLAKRAFLKNLFTIMKLFSVEEAEKIVVCTMEKDEAELRTMYKRKTF
jgi:hypothetical protein